MLFLLSVSCQKDESPFEKSAAQRTEWELERYRFTLQARENWVVEYFPDADLAYGGWVFVMNFGEHNRVKMWFEGSGFVGEEPAHGTTGRQAARGSRHAAPLHCR